MARAQLQLRASREGTKTDAFPAIIVTQMIHSVKLYRLYYDRLWGPLISRCARPCGLPPGK